MPILILSVIIQAALVIHCIKTGRNTTWLYVIGLVPVLGPVAYFFMEILPDLMGTRAGVKAQRKINTAIRGNRDLNKARTEYAVADTVENTRNFAEELLERSQFDEAKSLYQKALRGIHKTDPYLLHGLAQAHYGLQEYQQSCDVLDELIAENPDFKDQEAHLLYACTMQALGARDKALEEYKVLDGYYAGPKASYLYSQFLESLGRTQESQVLLEKIIFTAKTSASHYRDMHREWIKKAKQDYRG